MPAQIKFTDKKDGTGVDVRVTGLADPPLNLYTAPFNGYIREDFTLAGTFAADGTQTLALPVGPHKAIVTENGVPVNDGAFRVSDGDEGTHYRCLVAVREFVIAMALEAFPADPDKHKIHKVPARTRTEFGLGDPGKAGSSVHGAHYWMVEESLRPGSNQSQDVTYPVQIGLIRTDGTSNNPNSFWTFARQRLTQAFHSQALPAVPEIHTVTMRPLTIHGSLKADLMSVIVNCETEQCSGVS